MAAWEGLVSFSFYAGQVILPVLCTGVSGNSTPPSVIHPAQLLDTEKKHNIVSIAPSVSLPLGYCSHAQARAWEKEERKLLVCLASMLAGGREIKTDQLVSSLTAIMHGGRHQGAWKSDQGSRDAWEACLEFLSRSSGIVASTHSKGVAVGKEQKPGSRRKTHVSVVRTRIPEHNVNRLIPQTRAVQLVAHRPHPACKRLMRSLWAPSWQLQSHCSNCSTVVAARVSGAEQQGRRPSELASCTTVPAGGLTWGAGGSALLPQWQQGEKGDLPAWCQ